MTLFLMKNITVSVDDDVYRKARIADAEADSSVSGLVRQFLNALVGTESAIAAEEALPANRVLRGRGENAAFGLRPI
jgi:hypothetical protein